MSIRGAWKERQAAAVRGRSRFHRLGVALVVAAASFPPAQADGRMDVDTRAVMTERQMTDVERLQMLHGFMPIPQFFPEGAPIPTGIPVTAGFVRGIARLGVPDLLETDASLGVTNPMQIRLGDTATALPSGQALALCC